MNSEMCWEVEDVRDRVDPPDYFEGTNKSGTELLAGQVHPDVPGWQPDLLIRLIGRSLRSSEASCHPVRCALVTYWYPGVQPSGAALEALEPSWTEFC